MTVGINLRFVWIAIITMLLSGCVSQEQRQMVERRIANCEQLGGVAQYDRVFLIFERCVDRFELARLEKKKQDCISSGGLAQVDARYRLYQKCLSPAVVQAQVNAYQRAARATADGFKNAPCIACGLSDRFGNEAGETSSPSYPAPAPSYTAPSSVTDWDWDWDYQPGNGQWVCRGIQTGRYASPDRCAMDLKDDNRWPG